jgi:predicted ferric reductase
MSKELALSALWAWLFVALVAAPLIFLSFTPPPGRDFAGELGAALGFLSLSTFATQFALTARFRWLEPPLGTDLVYAFHRHVTFVALGFAVAHAVLSSGGAAAALGLLDPRAGGFAAFAGVLALAIAVAITATTLARRRLRLEYDLWRRLHGALALSAVLLAAHHVLRFGGGLSTPRARAAWALYTVAWAALLFRVRLLKPLQMRRRPYVVRSVTPLPGPSIVLALDPRGHAGLRFEAGQFAWITVGESPFAAAEHPFSFSGAADDAPRLEFTIKERGDWTRAVQAVRPGTPVFVDGPFGTLCPARYPRAPGYGFVAGGVGIAPILSMLRTLAARGDRRPMVLVDANDRWDGVLHREEIAALARRLRLTVVHVLREPPPGWTGERGLVTDALLARVAAPARWEWFVCGPPPMMDLVERGLRRAGVPIGRVHAERFDLA